MEDKVILGMEICENLRYNVNVMKSDELGYYLLHKFTTMFSYIDVNKSNEEVFYADRN